MYKIGEVKKITGLSADTLRYYEKLGVLSGVSRNAAGVRLYSDKNISTLNFIKRAQQMNFSLLEIKALVSMRENPQHARDSVRQLTADKLKQIEAQLDDLTTLRNEMRLLLNLCHASEGGCPIIEGLDAGKKR
ncbi:MAG TPA: heavy metal-responsive transcriptional regulator [Thiotrichales bacterium]|nr:heavy metal-responsive transcriptional regulator [Thiotrichales bacterium]